VLGTARAAHGQDQALVSLTWTAPSECPTEEQVRSQAVRLLAGPPIRPDRRVFATAQVVHLATGPWRVELSMSSATAEGKRSVESSTCNGLADATALIIAIMVDPDRATAAAAAPGASSTSEGGASGSQGATAPATPIATRTATPRPAAIGETAPFSRLRFSAGAWALLDATTLPAPAYGVGLGAAVTMGRLRFDVGGGFLPDRTYSVSSDPGVGADMRLLSGSGDVAYVIRLANPTSDLDLALGGGVEATYIHAEGVPLRAPVVGVAGDAVWAALRAGATLTAPIYRPVFVHLEVLGVVPLERPPFVINPIGTVHQPWYVSARLGVGAEVHF
jgi:hypothetical protein